MYKFACRIAFLFIIESDIYHYFRLLLKRYFLVFVLLVLEVMTWILSQKIIIPNKLIFGCDFLSVLHLKFLI